MPAPPYNRGYERWLLCPFLACYGECDDWCIAEDPPKRVNFVTCEVIMDFIECQHCIIHHRLNENVDHNEHINQYRAQNVRYKGEK